MNLSGLSFDNIPPFEVPMRFFIMASFFGILCAIILALGGQGLWFSRWNPYTLALTHALVLGVFTMVMCGAMLQLISVLGGRSVSRVQLIATTSLFGLSIGTLILIGGFILSESWLIATAFAIVVSSIGLVVVALLFSIGVPNAQQHSLTVMRLAIGSLLLLLLIASLLICEHFFDGTLNQRKQLTNAHAAMGLAGWISLLIMAVSFQVLPMFHVAPSFPIIAQRLLPKLLFSTLIARFLLAIANNSSAGLAAVDVVITLSLIVYALVTIRVIYRRKRKIPDHSIILWYLGLTTLSVMMLLSLLPSSIAPTPVALGALFCFGWVLSIILAMLVKMAPFLAYIHLQRQCGCNLDAFSILPNVYQLLSKPKIKYLLISHGVSFILLITTLCSQSLYQLFGLSLLIEFSYLAVILFGVSAHYKQVSRQISQLN